MQALLIFLLSSIFYFYQYIIQISPSAIGEDLLQDFLVTDHRLGILSSAFYLSYTLMQIPAGILLDRFGPHRLLPLASLLCAIGCIIFSIAPYFYIASLSRLLIGFGAAFSFLGSVKLITQWFPAQRYALFLGLLVSIGLLGATIGEEPLAYVVKYIGWRNTMMTLGLLGFVLSFFLFVFIKNNPQRKTNQSPQPLSLYETTLRHIVHKKQLWFIAAYFCCIATPFYVFCTLWGVPFLMVRYQITESMATMSISLILIGQIIGAPFWGAISDGLKRRIPNLMIAVIGPICTLFIIIYLPFSDLRVPEILLFLFGFFISAYISGYAIARDISPKKNIAMISGFLNTIEMLAVTLSLPFLGRILDFFWQGNTAHGVRVYPLVGYQYSMTLILILIFLSLFFIVFIKETYAKSLCRHNSKIGPEKQ